MENLQLKNLLNRLSLSIPKIEGWCPVEKAHRMALAVVEAKSDISVELGIFGGRGVITMALAHQLVGKGVAWGFDPWSKSDALEDMVEQEHLEWWSKCDLERVYRGFINKIIEHNVLSYCFWARLRSDQCVKLFEDNSIGVLHADSNHCEKISSDEVLRWKDKVKPGGYWFADDIDWPSTKKAQELLVENGFKLIEDHKKWALYQKS